MKAPHSTELVTPMQRRRLQLEMTLRDLAHFTGVAASTLNRLERREIESSPAIKAKIARALETPVQVLWPHAREQDDER